MPSQTRSLLDRDLGMLYYITSTEGIGGILREKLDDFKVYEIALGNVICEPGCSNYIRGQGNYVWLLLEKRGIDTITAIRAIARVLGVSHKKFSAAGLKDSRAVTFQLICAEGVDPSAVPHFISKKVLIHDVFTMPFKLAPGMLQGNLFDIIIRKLNVSAEDAEKIISKTLLEIREYRGIPNYYGYQRFGTIRPITHIVGKLIIQSNFEEAIREILIRIFPYESEKAKEARKYLASTWDLEGALKLFPLRLHHERIILHYLIKHSNDYFGAIRTLPLTVRQLFIEAYQAYLFNLVLSARIEMELPLALPVPGDLVMLGDNESSVLRARESNLDKLRELVTQGKAQVVGNVFGYASVLAEGYPGCIEREVLEREGISLDAFRVKSMPEISSKGTVRPLAFNPSNLDWKVHVEENPRAHFRFVLRKGSYATVFIREIVKPENPVTQGF